MKKIKSKTFLKLIFIIILIVSLLNNIKLDKIMQNQNEDINYLEYKIKQAQDNNEPIDKYVLREIDWLKQQLEQFLAEEKEQGIDIENDFSIAEVKIKQYAMMKQLAQKINYSTEEFEEEITKIKKNLFGEENYNNFFDEDKSVSEI